MDKKNEFERMRSERVGLTQSGLAPELEKRATKLPKVR